MELKTLIELFYQWEEERADQVYLRQPFGPNWEEYTFKEVGQMARKLATGLQSLGLKKGDHVGLVSKNCREWIIADLAIMMGGFVSVPFFPTLTGPQIKQVLELGDVKALFVGKMEVWDDMKTGVPEDMPVIKFPHYKGNSQIDRGEDWHEFMNKFEPLASPCKPERDDLWTVIFTSGTTGTPKGVMLNYSAPYEVLRVDREHDTLKLYSGETRLFSFLPLNHIAERIATQAASLSVGAPISFTESLDTFAANLASVKPTLFFAVPRIWTKFQMGVLAKMPQAKLDRLLKIPIIGGIVKNKIKKTLGLDKARTMLTGAAPMADSTKDWFAKLGIVIQEVYGMTETCGGVVLMPKDNIRRGCIGPPMPEVEAKIDPETEELSVKCDWLMEGYYKSPDKTAEMLRDGWLYTGDRGEIDDHGYIRLTGRVKDAFKTAKGKYIVPAPIEWSFSTNTDIEQVCLVGLGMPQPMALVVPSEVGMAKDKESLRKSLEETLNEANKSLPNYKRVSTIVITKEIWSVENGLLTPTLKVKRNVMDDRYLDKYLEWHETPSPIVWEQ